MKTKLAILVILLATCVQAADQKWPIWEGWELMGSAGVFSYDTTGNAKTVVVDIKEKHHYFAVSVIFDNGKNLSYIWSANLAKEYGFQCPLDDWKDKETHVVVESGPARLNQVLSYKRNIMADYARFIGGTMPAKVSKVWMVALGKGGEKEIRARVMKLAIESEKHAPTNYLY
ncbi:MAG: DUF3047 domain-containing protein [Acidobacteriia bacterium]|nr:DUF3047 domain-containing protein [Terriglobia bacterium]